MASVRVGDMNSLSAAICTADLQRVDAIVVPNVLACGSPGSGYQVTVAHQAILSAMPCNISWYLWDCDTTFWRYQHVCSSLHASKNQTKPLANILHVLWQMRLFV